MKRTILSLCDPSGAWPAPYEEAGYEVVRVELKEGVDVRLYEPPPRVHGILAAPPCTYFSRMRMCRGRPSDAQLIEGLSVVDACLRIIWRCRPAWWALENPQGYLACYLGQPVMKFHPWEFGDAYTKRTWLWGDFVPPLSNGSAVPVGPLLGSANHKAIAHSFPERARTPAGFARAFFEANP